MRKCLPAAIQIKTFNTEGMHHHYKILKLYWLSFCKYLVRYIANHITKFKIVNSAISEH